MEPGLGILIVILRIVGISVCVKAAKARNRNTFGWGFFGFMSPIIAMIWIQFMKPIVKWENQD